MQKQVDDLITEYAAVDSVAADILSDKHQMVDLDGKRNKSREALRQLRSSYPSVQEGASQSWVCFGNTFIKMDTRKCIEMLEKDQSTVTAEIDQLRDGLKSKVKELNQMEGRAELKGFELKGMSFEEVMRAGQ